MASYSIDLKNATREDLENAIIQITGRPMTNKYVGGPGFNLPLTNQTDPRKFPDYSEGGPAYRPFPRVILRQITAQDVEEWIVKNRLLDNGREFWMERPPTVGEFRPVKATSDQVEKGWAQGVGFELVARNPEEEMAIYEELGIPMPRQKHGGKFGLSVDDEGALKKELEALRGKVAVLEAEKKIAGLEAKVAAAPTPHVMVVTPATADVDIPPKKHGGRPKGSKNKAKSNVVPLGQFRPEGD